MPLQDMAIELKLKLASLGVQAERTQTVEMDQGLATLLFELARQEGHIADECTSRSSINLPQINMCGLEVIVVVDLTPIFFSKILSQFSMIHL